MNLSLNTHHGNRSIRDESLGKLPHYGTLVPSKFTAIGGLNMVRVRK